MFEQLGRFLLILAAVLTTLIAAPAAAVSPVLENGQWIEVAPAIRTVSKTQFRFVDPQKPPLETNYSDGPAAIEAFLNLVSSAHSKVKGDAIAACAASGASCSQCGPDVFEPSLNYTQPMHSVGIARWDFSRHIQTPFIRCTNGNCSPCPNFTTVVALTGTTAAVFDCPLGFTPDATRSICRKPMVVNACGGSRSPLLPSGGGGGTATRHGQPVTTDCVKVQPEQDYRSADGQIHLERHYRTHMSGFTPLNTGTPFGRLNEQWGISFGQRLAPRSQSDVVVAQRVDGTRWLFQKQPSGTWKSLTDPNIVYREIGSVAELVLDNDTVEQYTTPEGRLQLIKSRDGRQIALTYSGNELSLVTDAFGKQLQFNYVNDDLFPPPAVPSSAIKNIASVTLPGGLSVPVSIENNHAQIISAGLPSRRQRSYVYSNLGPDSPFSVLTGVRDETDVQITTLTYLFDTIWTERAGGVDRYKVFGQRDVTTGVGNVQVDGPLGRIADLTFAVVGGMVRETQRSGPGATGAINPAVRPRTYDANNNIASEFDASGVEYRYEYDLARNLQTRRIEAFGRPEQRTVETTWHPTFRLPTLTVEKNAAGASLRETTMVYDTRGNMTSRAVRDVASNTTRTTTWTYTYATAAPWHAHTVVENGPRADATDTITRVYWAHDATCTDPTPIPNVTNLGCRGQLKTVTNGKGHVTNYTVYDHHGYLRESVDANGLKNTYTYDNAQRMTTSALVSGAAQLTTSFSYDSRGLLSRTTLPDASYIDFTYDAAHRLTGMRDSLNNEIVYTLDAAGNRTAEDVKDPQGTLRRKVSRSFDVINRVRGVTGEVQ